MIRKKLKQITWKEIIGAWRKMIENDIKNQRKIKRKIKDKGRKKGGKKNGEN